MRSPSVKLPSKIKEILHRQKDALLRARDRICRQAEELDFLKDLLARRLGFDKERGVVVEIKSAVVECPQALDTEAMMVLAARGPTAKA